VNIHIGNAFDVVAEHKQTDYKRIDTHTWEMEFEVTLRNHKDSAVTVQVNEPIGGDWEMVSSPTNTQRRRPSPPNSSSPSPKMAPRC